jgi:hypothetical protein
VRRTQVVYYAARRPGPLVQDQVETIELKDWRCMRAAAIDLMQVMMPALPDGQTHVPSRPALQSPMNTRALLMFLFALFIAAMLGLAAGATWMVVTLYLGHPMPWLALLFGALLAWTIRNGVRPPGIVAALLAAFATALAAVYVNMLIASVRIAGNMGMGLIEAIHTAGIGMLWLLAQLAVTPVDLGWAMLAMLLAAWLAWRTPRKRASPVSS